MSDFKQPGSPDEAAALLAEREHLRALLRMMPVGVFIVDAQGRPVEANPAARALWGGALPQVGLEGYGVYEGYWPGSGQRLEPHEWALARTLRDGQPVVNEEVDIVAFDGTRRTVLLSTQALRDGQGLLLGAVAVGVDITPHRQAEHARLEAPRAHDASRALLEGFFAASPVGMGFVDRELRYVDVNPVLAAINGLPREEHLGRRVHEVLSEVEESKHIEGLVRQVLESGEPWLNQDSLAPPRP
ncbi:MAG: PAS domain-containing protein, partial [Archangium sp.]